MRGYRASTHPGVDAAYDGRTLANDFKSLMEQLGHDRCPFTSSRFSRAGAIADVC